MTKREKTLLDFELAGGLAFMHDAMRQRRFGYFSSSFVYTLGKAKAVVKRNTARFVREMRERREINELNNDH